MEIVDSSFQYPTLEMQLDTHGWTYRGGAANQEDEFVRGETTVPESVLDAIRQGQWDFEPECVEENQYESTGALPGSEEKIGALAARALEGLPLWHPGDRRSYDDSEEALQ